MMISKSGKIIIGILTIGQLFLSLLIVVWFFASFFPVVNDTTSPEFESRIIMSLGKFLAVAIILGTMSLGLLIFYMIHAGTNKYISTAMRVVWVLLLFFLGAIVQVVYYFMEIVPEKSLTAKLEGSE